MLADRLTVYGNVDWQDLAQEVDRAVPWQEWQNQAWFKRAICSPWNSADKKKFYKDPSNYNSAADLFIFYLRWGDLFCFYEDWILAYWSTQNSMHFCNGEYTSALQCRLCRNCLAHSKAWPEEHLEDPLTNQLPPFSADDVDMVSVLPDVLGMPLTAILERMSTALARFKLPSRGAASVYMRDQGATTTSACAGTSCSAGGSTRSNPAIRMRPLDRGIASKRAWQPMKTSSFRVGRTVQCLPQGVYHLF